MSSLQEIYGNKIRLRVCGILRDKEKVLLVNHTLLNSENEFWNFPGGGLQKGENIKECLKREFLEETSLNVSVGKLIYVHQFLNSNFHAVELYFRVSSDNFAASLGKDPELNILSDLKWFSKNEISKLTTTRYPDFLPGIAFK